MDSLFTINIDSIDGAFFATLDGNSNDFSVEGDQMKQGIKYGPYTKYIPTKFPNDPTVYPGGQVSIQLINQQCGPPHPYLWTTLCLGSDENGYLNEAWAFHVSMTPANPRSGSRGQFATFTAVYGSNSTKPSLHEIMQTAFLNKATTKLVEKGTVNTVPFQNGQCFQVNFNIDSSK
jgi:hypothetical protein